MLFLCLALSVPGVQAVQGNEETALSGAYALMGLSKVIGSIADDLLAIIKEQAVTRKFQAREEPCQVSDLLKSGFSAKNEQMLKGKSAKISHATKENQDMNTSDFSKLVKPKQTRKSSSLKCGCQ